MVHQHKRTVGNKILSDDVDIKDCCVVIDRELSNMNEIMDITSTFAKEEGGCDVVIAAMVEEEEEEDDDMVSLQY